jgi:membrane protein YqaA with SNARE-associated domain
MEHFRDQCGSAAIFIAALVEAACNPFPPEVTFGCTSAQGGTTWRRPT